MYLLYDYTATTPAATLHCKQAEGPYLLGKAVNVVCPRWGNWCGEGILGVVGGVGNVSLVW